MRARGPPYRRDLGRHLPRPGLEELLVGGDEIHHAVFAAEDLARIVDELLEDEVGLRLHGS